MKTDKNLPAVSAQLTMENWQDHINTMACQSAHDALVELGPHAALELAFSTLHTYFLLTYSAALPFLEHDGTLPARLDTLRKIINSCGMEFDISIATQGPNHQ